MKFSLVTFALWIYSSSGVYLFPKTDSHFSQDWSRVKPDLESFSRKQQVGFAVYDLKKRRMAVVCSVDDFSRPQALGSLLKPFVALAAAESGVPLFAFKVYCEASDKSVPVKESCWDRRGHGDMDFTNALTLSCNYFFSSLAEKIDENIWRQTFKTFGLFAPDFSKNTPLSQRKALAIGSRPDFLMSPAQVLFAYVALLGEDLMIFDFVKKETVLLKKNEEIMSMFPGMREVMSRQTAVLALTQKTGTVKNQNHFPIPAYVKTGTSFAMKGSEIFGEEDSQVDPSQTDGWAFVALPVGRPRFAILLKKSRGTGAGGAYPEVVKLLQLFYKDIR